VLNGYGGHRPMIWRPSDMVSMVDRWNIFVDRVVHHEMLIDLFTQQHAVDDAIGNSFTL
jgi:hypothetical protein